MAIGEQFAGLPMDQLIGAPLTAAADASIRLANSTADFINRVGFDAQGNVRKVEFRYEKRSVNEDGTSNLDEMKVDVPILAIVPIPNLQVDEVNILFDMEVKQSEKSESSLDVGAKLNATANFGIVKVNVSGSVSVHQANTRSSDNSAKYHVDVRATNHGTPEGLARVLDMMAANVAPSLVGSTIKDGNGQSLPEQARIRAEHLKELRQQIRQIETRLSTARDGLENGIRRLKSVGENQYNEYRSKLRTLMDGDKDSQKYQNAMNEMEQVWTKFQKRAADNIKMLANNKGKIEGVASCFALKAVDDKGDVAGYEKEEHYYEELSTAQTAAVKSQKKVQKMEEELFNKQTEYDNAAAGVAPASEEGNGGGQTRGAGNGK